jgi:AmmeMemoRadiSam system protein B
VLAVVAPHAGHLYSGPVAGHAFAAVLGMKPQVVAVISPMHYPYTQPLLTTAHHAYSTPLGLAPVDLEVLQALNEALKADLGFGLSEAHKDPEHSLEIELPFLQRALEEPFALLPVMVRDQSPRTTEALGRALARTLEGRDALLVASTDLSHFFPQKVAEELDREILRQVEALDPYGVQAAEAQGKGYACGYGALAAVLWAALGLGANWAKIVRYGTSGDINGDYDRVVGYGAAVIAKSS